MNERLKKKILAEMESIIGNSCYNGNIQGNERYLGFIICHLLTSSHIHKSDYLRLFFVIKIMT